MDLRLYYQKLREVESKLVDEFPIVVSNQTMDGGKDGTKTEVPRGIAAKLIVEGVARLASKEQVKAYRDFQAEGKRIADQIAAANRLQLSVLSTMELDRLRNDARNSKEKD
jgi:hypothetical protein